MEIFKRFLDDPEFDRINNMVRWNGLNRIKDETVAHHSYIVSWFSRILAEEIFEDDSIKFKILSYALFHDYDEIFTGDILNPFKYNDYNGEEVRKVIDSFLKFKIEKTFGGESNTDIMFKGILTKATVPIVCQKLVKVADWLGMYFYLKKERQLGNQGVSRQNEHCISSIRSTCAELIYLLEEVHVIDSKVTLDVLYELKNLEFI